MQTGYTQHVPVMLEEVLKFLQPRAGGHYVDGTLGGGGHTQAILERSAPDGKVLGIDADAQAVARIEERLSDFVNNGRLVLVHGNFAELARIVHEAGFVSVEGVLLDLGFSSYQVDEPQRGFSFSADGPLDMRLDQSQAESAADIVNSASEQELADIFWRYGEEKRSRQIARRVVRQRERGAITRTTQLAQLAAAGVPYKPGAIHPATRVFQALRIAVNHELERLEKALPQILDVLSMNKALPAGGQEEPRGWDGRMVTIAFHSLEDRLIKEFMRREAKDCLCPPRVPVCVCGHKARLRLLTPKPVTPTVEEITANPRARSAKLRAAEIVVGS
jgi:16S rRNA (cytosine1402-N4)-methyltransferase